MNAFKVHIYAVVRVTLEGVVATGPEHAADVAQRCVDLDRFFQNACCADTCPQIAAVEYTGDLTDIQVEEASDL